VSTNYLDIGELELRVQMDPHNQLLVSELESKERGSIFCVGELLKFNEDFFGGRGRRNVAELELFTDLATSQDGRATFGDLEVNKGLVDICNFYGAGRRDLLRHGEQINLRRNGITGPVTPVLEQFEDGDLTQNSLAVVEVAVFCILSIALEGSHPLDNECC
jgi:hypothetical protein